jgi:hypothetical protein
MICVEDRESEGGIGWMYWSILLSHRGYGGSSVESLRLLYLLFWSELVGLPIQLYLDVSRRLVDSEGKTHAEKHPQSQSPAKTQSDK